MRRSRSRSRDSIAGTKWTEELSKSPEASSSTSAACSSPAPLAHVRERCSLKPPDSWDMQAVLFQAASCGHATSVRRALERGAVPDLVALHHCCCGFAEAHCVCLGYSALHCAAQVGSLAAVQVLLQHSADPCILSGRLRFGLGRFEDAAGPGFIIAEGLTPIHVAAACGHLDVVKMLLKYLADPHAGAVEPRKTALGFAVFAQEDEIADFLRKAKLDRVEQRARESSSGAEAFLARQSCDNESLVPLRTARIDRLASRIRAREQQKPKDHQHVRQLVLDDLEALRNAARRDGRGAGGVAAGGGG